MQLAPEDSAAAAMASSAPAGSRRSSICGPCVCGGGSALEVSAGGIQHKGDSADLRGAQRQKDAWQQMEGVCRGTAAGTGQCVRIMSCDG